jgi:hypothetical protein
MRRVFIQTCVLLSLVSGLVVSARVLGAGTPQPMAVMMFATEGCVQPCWHGIRPGTTTIQEAIATILADRTLKVFYQDERMICWRGPTGTKQNSGCASNIRSDKQIDQITIEIPDGELKIGDVIRALGQPIWILSYGCDDPMHFRGGVSVQFESPFVPRGRYNPNLVVTRVTYRLRRRICTGVE